MSSSNAAKILPQFDRPVTRYLDGVLGGQLVQTEMLQKFVGRRLRAGRVIQRTNGHIELPGALDHTLVFHVGGGAAHRYDGARKTGFADKYRASTILPAGKDSSWRIPDDVDMLHLYLDDAELKFFAASEFGFDVDKLEMRDLMCVDDKFMQHLAPLILQELQSDIPQNLLMLDGFDSVVAGHMLRAYSNMSDIVLASEDRERNHRDKKIAKAIEELVMDRLDENLSAQEIGHIINVAPFRLMRLFKKEMGISVHQFVLHKRVAYVHDKLKNSDKQLADLAYEAGFSSQSHMSSSYTKVMGITPGRHRKQLRD